MLLPLALLLQATAPAAPTDYALSFEPGADEWRVEARLAGRGEETLEFWFPRWTPGAYHLADFGRFVEDLQAFDESGARLPVEHDESAEVGRYMLRGTAGAKQITVRYRALSASEGTFTNDVIDVEANRIAAAYAYVNPPSLFGFVPARGQEPVRLTLALPEGWKAATVLERDGEGRYLAPSYYRFEDSPFLFSPTLETAAFTAAGREHAVSAHGKSAADVRAIADGCKRIVEAGAELMGGLPYERYHFLYGFVPEAGGSGLEHSFSTLILVGQGQGVGEAERMFWDVTAHEFFHLWCAERIHVQAVHRPDLTRPLETGTLWLNEGVTEYFCRHLLLHAGFLDERQLLQSYFSGPGLAAPAGLEPWTEVSRKTAVWEGADDLNTFATRMYRLGPPVILGLDLEMRRATQGERGVQDLLRHLVQHYVAEDRGFGEDELDDVLRTVAGEPAVRYFARHIDGREPPDPAAALDVIGYRLVKGRVEPLPDPSVAQLAARRDFLAEPAQR